MSSPKDSDYQIAGATKVIKKSIVPIIRIVVKNSAGEKEFENYHFQEQIQDGEVLFDYRLYKGRSNSRNAIRLLELLGYETDIVEGANEMVARFLQNGKWSLE